MRYMIIERFRNGDPLPVYRRFRDQGRLAPDGLHYIDSCVTHDLTTCYQVMECEDRALLDTWMANWGDLVEFEVIPVITSAEAATSSSVNVLRSSSFLTVARARLRFPAVGSEASISTSSAAVTPFAASVFLLIG